MFCETTWLAVIGLLTALASFLLFGRAAPEDQVRNDEAHDGSKEGVAHVSVSVHGALLPFPIFYFGLDFSSS